MNLVAITLAIYIGINAVGLLWSAAIIHFGVPEPMSIQNRSHKWKTLTDRLPLVFLNQLILMALVFGALQMFGNLFSQEMPSWPILAIQLLVIVLFDDLIFYVFQTLLAHRALLHAISLNFISRIFCLICPMVCCVSALLVPSKICAENFSDILRANSNISSNIISA